MSTKLPLCKNHLTLLYEAIERGDIRQAYQLEHELTYTQVCVACAYSLKAKGDLRLMLDHYLKKQGFEIDPPQEDNIWVELRFWTIRLTILALMFFIYFSAAVTFKGLILNSKSVALGGMAIGGVFLGAIASFVLFEEWVLE